MSGGIAGERDVELVAAARAGEIEAWVALYRGVYPRLWAYLARRVGPEHADDMVSETFCRAIAGIARMQMGSVGFDGWVFGIARRVAADHHRATGRAKRPVPAPAYPMTAEPGEALSTEEEHRGVRKAFERLSATERELLELRVIAGLSTEQVAAILGKRAGAVRTAQSRALAHLRRILSGDDSSGVTP